MVDEIKTIGTAGRVHSRIDTTTVTVSDTGSTTLVTAFEANGLSGAFVVDNTNGAATDIVVFPEHSPDGTNWFQIDNESAGTTISAAAIKSIPWLGKYKNVRLRATAAADSIGVKAGVYVSSQ
jgi:hypothetical protein